jgi:hypothetical protein
MSDGPEALQQVGAIVSKQHVRDELTDVFRDFTTAPHDDKYGVSSNSTVDLVAPVLRACVVVSSRQHDRPGGPPHQDGL